MGQKDCFGFKFKSYQRPFPQPLHTHHGVWRVREGVIITLEDDTGNTAYGEIAPIPWFGSETVDSALEFCQQLGDSINLQDIVQISDRLPACQFAFESAGESLVQQYQIDFASLNYCSLLPAGEAALTALKNLDVFQTEKNLTFKWKIGVISLTEEIEILKQLVEALPPSAKLRLDANGGLHLSQARKLLTVTENIPAIEFIEQPLSPEYFTEMLTLSGEHSTTLALDESVANLDSLEKCFTAGWQGVFVLKAAIMGYPSRLRQFCRDRSIDAVFSSVFETEIGRQAVLNLAVELNNSDRAVGFSHPFP
ncbi:MAG: o-succinylbenzoate synthase [Pleurocapsa sp.]